MRNKIISLAFAAVTGLGALALAVPALAATPACSGAASGTCGSEVNVSGNAFNVRHDSARVNAKIIAYPDSVTKTGGDFTATDPSAANPDMRTFQYSPADVPSGLCISEPSVTAGTGLVLRPCRAAGSVNAKYQEFTGTDTQDTAGTPWVNVASGLTVMATGTARPLAAVATVTNQGGSYWGWNAPAVAPAS